ncbi:MAG: hypothetical protein ACOYL3_01180 [Desulfuromonadaceae bacterium]
MIRIKPSIEFEENCPRCEGGLVARKVLWQGIHVCVVSECSSCRAEIIADLKVGQALFTPYRVDLKKGLLFGDDGQCYWFGTPLLDSLQHPDNNQGISLNVETYRRHSQVIILNCIDFLYGHSLLKLLNADFHLRKNPDLGLIVIAPRCLLWMVPEGVAEVWTINVPLSKSQNFYPRLDQLIQAECERFNEIYLSPAHSHPAGFNITRFTGIERHDFSSERFRITFIWREDRPWFVRRIWIRIGRRLSVVKSLLLAWQNFKVTMLFSALRTSFPAAEFTIAGLGTATAFPTWVDDRRVDVYDDEKEHQMCRVYSESRLVIGVHGSNMLLPSAHAGMTIDLTPDDRWPNMAQDMLYQETDSRMAAYRYRYLPLGVKLSTLALIANRQISGLSWFKNAMTDRIEERDR